MDKHSKDLKVARNILRNKMRHMDFPPKFDINEWNSDMAKIEYLNCYAYAMGFDIPIPDQRIWGYLGWTDGHFDASTDKIAINRFMKDVRAMGRKIQITKNENVSRKGYKVGLYINSKGSFHFIRQEREGFWTEKDGYGGKVQIITDDKGKTLNPSEFSMDEMELVSLFEITR